MKVLLFLPKAFEHMESSVFIDVLGWANDLLNIDIQLDTGGFFKNVISTFNVPICVDKLIEEICVDDYEAIAIPGGFGEFGYLEEGFDERFLELIREFHRQDKIVASVCMGAIPLGKSGILNGKKAKTYHLGNSTRLELLKSFGVNTVATRIVVDSKIITSCGPETAVWVAFTLLEMLTSIEETNKIKEAMGYIFTIDKNGEIVNT
ncbi:MAG: DJ-1/PfpI family protein [Coprobacillaceae bacterium]